MTTTNPEIIISFLAEHSVREGIFGDSITAAWAHSTYSAYSHYGEDLPDFTDADVAAIKNEAEIIGEHLVREACVKAADVVIIKLTAQAEAIRAIRAWRLQHGFNAPGPDEAVRLGDLHEDYIGHAIDETIYHADCVAEEDGFPMPLDDESRPLVEKLVYERLGKDTPF